MNERWWERVGESSEKKVKLPCVTTLWKLSYFNCTIPFAVANISRKTLVSSSIANKVKLNPLPLRPSKLLGLLSRIERAKDNLGRYWCEGKEEEIEEELGSRTVSRRTKRGRERMI